MTSGFVARVLPLLAALVVTASSACAEEVTICYNYGCYAKAPVEFSATQLAPLQGQLAATADAAAERAAIAAVVGRMYAIAGEQTPVWRDKGGNYADGGDNGKMDCIDHSTNTSAFLRLLQARGWLKYHEVLEPRMRSRFFFAEHWSAIIRERETQEVFVVDSWFFDNGQPAAVLPLDDWLAGKSPRVQ
ncbi:MAG: hypothetical protein IH604_14370 [Burkholderiales bacterium]|nr:hypothetical protein [Burkholderiales bacterium]